MGNFVQASKPFEYLYFVN